MTQETGYLRKVQFLTSGSSRGSRAVMLATFCLLILILPAFLLVKSSEKEAKSYQEKYREMTVLSEEYRSLRNHVNVMDKKTMLTATGSIATALDDISSSLRIRDRLISVKSAGQRDIKDSIKEERAEVLFEKLSMNELVNLLYKTENVPLMIAVKRVHMKKTFENPELLNVSMTVVLFTSQ